MTDPDAPHVPQFRTITDDPGHTRVVCLICGDSKTATYPPIREQWRRQHAKDAQTVRRRGK